MRLRTALAGALVALPFAMPAHATPAQADTWNFRQIHIGRSQEAGHDGAGVTVAVVDTWIDRTHPDLGGRVLSGADCAGGTCKPGVVKADGCDAHGTHVAGTIASTTYGVAPAAHILPLRVLKWDGAECQGMSGDVAAAITYAVAHGAQVVNVSVGAAVPLAGKDPSLDNAVADAARAGVLVVFAAGNQDVPVADSFGGDALIVAATAKDGGLASYSQYGAGVDLAAPGGDAPGDTCTLSGCVISTWWDQTGHNFAALAGTSMAAPHVAGIAALLFAQKPRTRADVIARLRNTAHPLAQAGSGLVDAAAALGASAAPRVTATPATRSAPPVVRVTPRRSRPRARPSAPSTPAPKPPARKPAPKPSPTPSGTITISTVDPPLAAPLPATGSRAIPATAAALLLATVAAATVATARRT
jgi:subtilisin family serine protease